MVPTRPSVRRTPPPPEPKRTRPTGRDDGSPPPRSGIRRDFGVRAVRLVAIVSIALWSRALPAQLMERSTVFENARIVDGRGRVIDGGTIIVKGGRIVGAGRGLEAPLLSKKIDLEGRVVTPGLVDVWSGLGMTDAAASTRPTARAEDAFDHYADAEIREAWSQGVTAVYVTPGGPSGVTGQGAIIRLGPRPEGGHGVVTRSGASLAIDLDSSSGTVARARRFQEIRGQFEAAERHRQAWEEYEEAIEEYEKELAEYIEKHGDDAVEGGEKKKATPNPSPAPAPPEQRRGRGRRRRPPRVETPTPERTDSTASAAALQDSGEKKDDEKEKPKPPTPPREPATRDDYDLYLKAIDGDLVVRIRAERSSDLLNALALIDEYELDAVIEGATEGYLVAEPIARSEVPVVLGEQALPERRNGWRSRAVADNGAQLRAAGVEVHVGSGGARAAARFAAMNALLAVGNGTIDDAIEHLTSSASRLLGVRELGRLGRGAAADLVVWTGPPEEPWSRVHSVYIDGERVYQAEEAKE